MSKLQTLIFDVDGTLADTERDGHRIAFNRAFAEAGLDWDWSLELYGELLSVTGGKERIRFYLEKYRPEIPLEDNALIADLHAAKTKYYQELLAEGKIPLRPGVKRLIEEARSSGVSLAIATTSAVPNVTALLEKYFDPSWFELIAAGDMVQTKKPAPDIYFYVLEQMNLQPQDCLVIEDSLQGLQAATAAGLKTIVTVNEFTKGEDFAGALLVVNHLGEPELPSTILAGNPVDVSYLDMATLYRLHSN